MVLAAVLFAGIGVRVGAQAPDGAMSEKEIETLREAAASPLDRIAAYEKMLNDRERIIEDLLARPRRPGYGSNMHDAMEEFGAIADELNDNLDDYSRHHRDVRKALPRLVASTERWSTALRAPADDEHYSVARRIALTTVKDTHDVATALQTELDAYFKDHPDALKAEKERPYR